MSKILIADDHPIVRRGLKQLLMEETGVSKIGEAKNARDALNLLNKQHWDAMVLDISMPGAGGLDLLKEIKKRHPRVPVLILSIHPEDQYAVRALRAGASGYMSKESAPDELLKALRKIIRGGRYVSESLAESLVLRLDDAYDTRPHEILSDREYEVMLMIASGMTVSEIAEKLSLSVKTISTHRTRIMDKMKMKSNVELIRYAIENDLIH